MMRGTAFFILVFSLSACNTRGMYEAIQISQQHDCAKLVGSQYEDCIDSVKKPYEEYERQRQESLQR